VDLFWAKEIVVAKYVITRGTEWVLLSIFYFTGRLAIMRGLLYSWIDMNSSLLPHARGRVIAVT
jgi:hypothetical protein